MTAEPAGTDTNITDDTRDNDSNDNDDVWPTIMKPKERESLGGTRVAGVEQRDQNNDFC